MGVQEEGIFKVHIEDEDNKLPLAFSRHEENLVIKNLERISLKGEWRLKERMKTVSVALVLCLNVGVDPPDLIKIDPCARLECWFGKYFVNISLIILTITCL
jgi:regulatory associated protein of mTOR